MLLHYPDYNLETIGRNLKIYREYYGYSAESIRKYLGLATVQSVYQYEQGLAVPRAQALLALMELYQLVPMDLRNEDFTGPESGKGSSREKPGQ